MALHPNNRCLSTPLRSLAPEPPPQDEEGWGEDLVSTAGMTPQQKQTIWRHIKAHEPELVAFFEDPQVKQILAGGAGAVFPRALVQRAIDEAKKVNA